MRKPFRGVLALLALTGPDETLIFEIELLEIVGR